MENGNLTNRHKTIYPKTSDGTIITTFENGEVLVEMIGMRMYFQSSNSEINPKTIQNQQGKVDFDELIYNNCYGNGIDLKIKHGTVGRKMDYIIHNRSALGTIPVSADFLVFEETIELPSGWKASINGKTENYDNLWNGRTMDGNIVSEGVYNYVLTTPNGDKHHGFVHVVH